MSGSLEKIVRILKKREQITPSISIFVFFRKLDLWVKITLVNPRVFEKPEIAHNSLNNGRRAVSTPFWKLIFCELFGIKIDLFRQIDQNLPKNNKNRPKLDFM